MGKTRSDKIASALSSEKSMAEAERKQAEDLMKDLDGGDGDDVLEQAIMAHTALADAHDERAAELESEMEAALQDEQDSEQEQDREQEQADNDNKEPLWAKAGDKAIAGAVRGACVHGAVKTAREENPELFDSMKKHWAKLDAAQPREVNGRPAPSSLAAGEFADAMKAAELVAEAGPAAGLG